MPTILSYLYDCTGTELRAIETCCRISNCRERPLVLQTEDAIALHIGSQNFEIFLLQSVLGEEKSCMSTRFLFPGLCRTLNPNPKL